MNLNPARKSLKWSLKDAHLLAEIFWADLRNLCLNISSQWSSTKNCNVTLTHTPSWHLKIRTRAGWINGRRNLQTSPSILSTLFHFKNVGNWCTLLYQQELQSMYTWNFPRSSALCANCFWSHLFIDKCMIFGLLMCTTWCDLKGQGGNR